MRSSEGQFLRRCLVESPLALRLSIVFFGVGLALCTGLYGLLAGPALKFALSDAPIALPTWLNAVGLPFEWLHLHRLYLLPGMIVSVACLKGVCHYGFVTRRYRFAHVVTRRLRRDLFRQLERAPVDELQRLGKAETVTRFVHDIDHIERFLSDGFVRAGQCALESMVLVVLCLVLDWRLSCLFFLVYPVVFYPLLKLTNRLKGEARTSQRAVAKAASVVQDQLHALRAIRSLHYPDLLRNRMDRAVTDVYKASESMASLKASASPIAEVLGALALAATLLVCAWRLADGHLSTESSVSFIACLLLLYKPIKTIGGLPHLLAPGRSAIARVLELEFRSYDEGGCQSPCWTGTLVELKDVAIRRGGETLFQAMNVAIQAGDMWRIVGRNGTGKSTLMEAMLGLRSVDDGVLKLGGVPVEQLDLKTWRDGIGWLPQEPQLIEGTIEENIVMGRPGFFLTDVLRTWSRLGFSAPTLGSKYFARTLQPEGRGLSGGEIRRILLARAYLSEPKILFLDEPDAFQDVDGRRAIWQSIARIKEEVTIVLITHDPESPIHLGQCNEFEVAS